MKIYSFPFAVTIESDLTNEDIITLQKYDPEALALYKTEENKTKELFRVCFYKGNISNIADEGIIFTGVTNKNGNAGATALIPTNVDSKEFINDNYADICVKLQKVEAQAKEALKNVNKSIDDFNKTVIDLYENVKGAK